MDPNTPHPTVDRDGRIFLAPEGPTPVVYPFPVDVEKLDSYDKLHYVMKHVVGSNYFYEADIKHALAARSNRHQRVVDLGCGSGVWLREMAEEFPHAQFTGVDIVDCWDRLEDEPDNIEFVIDDVRGRTRFADNTFDLVHLRRMRTAVVDFAALINEVARILRPGGLLLSGEWGRQCVVDHMQLELSEYAPAIAMFNDMIAEVLKVYTLAEDIVPLIRASGHFVNDRYVLFPFLYGECQPNRDDAAVGTAMGEQLMAHLDSMRHLFKTLRTDEELDQHKIDTLNELRTKPGVMCLLHLAIARKARNGSVHEFGSLWG